MEKENLYTNTELVLLKKLSTEFGLTLTSDEQFQKIQTGANYYVSFYMLGDRILFTFPSGDSSNLDMENYYAKREEFLNIYGPEDKKIVEIRNYSDIHGFPDKQSRIIQTKHLINDNDRLLAFIIFGAPLYVKMVFKVGMKINKTKFPALFVNNYKSSVNKAIHILNSKLYIKFSEELLQPKPEFNISTTNFNVEFSIIPNKLIYLNGKGSPNNSQMKMFCKSEKVLFNKYFSNTVPIYRISNYKNIKGASIASRLTYGKHLRDLYKKGKLVKHTLVVGANSLVRYSIAMLKKMFAFNTIFVDSLEEAFNTINLIESLNNESTLEEEQVNVKTDIMISRNEIAQRVDELLQFMGSLTWEKPLNSDLVTQKDNVFNPIYEALTIIKNDVNNLLVQRKKDEENLKMAYKRLELDLKKREKYEAERKSLEEQLHQSEKMQAIGQLAGGIAHDFNNQLAAIVGYSDLLKRNIPEHPKLQKYTDNIKLVTNRAKDLTSQLLAFARKGKYHSTDVNVHDLIHEVSNLSEHTMDKKITIKQELTALNPEIEGDPTQLQNVLLNLSINARDAMPDGGTITFKTENITSETDWFRNRGLILGPGKYLKLSVSDTGTGIPDGIRNHIFEPFFTTKKVGQGTGMGLAAVYGTIKNHNGSIEIDTTPGKGTTFHLIMPQHEINPQEQSDEIRSTEFSGDTGLGDTIFLIDDEETVLESTKELLQEIGYTVFAAKNPINAIEIFKNAYRQIDIVLLDMIMPQMGGAEVYEKLKEINNDVNVIITSGYSIEREQRLINENDNVYFIQKPYDIEELNSMAHRIIHNL